LAEALVFIVGISLLVYRCCTKRSDSGASVTTPTPAAAPEIVHEDGDGENQLFDDYFFKCCWCCIPICCYGVAKDDIFREREKHELRNKKLELHLDGKMVVNGPDAPKISSTYWGDALFYIFQKDHFLSIFYCDHEHPFTKRERLKVYWGMVATAAFFSTAFRPPQDCADYVNPKSPGYADMHTWGRIDAEWTEICESGMSPPNAQLMAVIFAAIIKVTYGMVLEYIAFCPCFVDFVGTFKTRSEWVGAVILNAACVLAVFQWYYAVRVIQHSPFKIDMIIAIINTVVTGIFTGWITYFIMYHCTRAWQTGCKETCHRCAQGADADGDGVECTEVCRACSTAWHEQKDTSWHEAPEGGVSNTVTVADGEKPPPSFCYKFLCPPCAVVGHEGCGLSGIFACFLGFIYTLFCWTPKQPSEDKPTTEDAQTAVVTTGDGSVI
jgi:hypothetical protein